MADSGTEIPDALKTKYALVFTEIDNLLLNNYHRKLNTYMKIGWDQSSAHEFIINKENYNRIASFNTSTVSFSASSRRNRYYEIYNSDEMLAYDVPYEGAVDVFNKYIEKFHVIVFTKREEDLRETTLSLLNHHGFKIDNGIQFIFKKKFENPHKFRNACLIDARTQFQTGVAFSHLPEEISVISQFNFTPVGFTSTHDYAEFIQNSASAICQDWNHIAQVLASVQ